LEVLKNPENRGIVICGSGIGISIAVNKVNGIRCGLVHDYLSTKLSREHNNCNVISLGANFIAKELAKHIVDTFLSTDFPGEERHLGRIDKISQIEKENKN
jgi:ribose 5-phosphate isomerase B